MDISFFRQHLEERLTWWTPFLDFDEGGIFVYPEDYSLELRSRRKVLLMHLRQLYNYSVGIDHGIEKAERAAHHLADTLDRVFPNREGELFVEDPFREYDTKFISAYTNAYAVIALSRFARATGDAPSSLRALKIYRDLDRTFTDAPLAERGSWLVRNPESGELHKKTDNSVIHRCEAALNLYRALKQTAPETLSDHASYLQEQMRDLATLFDRKISRPREGYTVEGFTDAFDPEPHSDQERQSLAHGFEWLGFCFEMETHAGLTLDFLDTRGRELAANTLANGLSENGCFRNHYVPAFQSGPQMADFWPQVEAPLGVLWARKRWGEDAFPLERAERMLSFYRSHMFWKPEFGGGILAQVSENGVPLRIHRGGAYKCDHHAVRMCEKVMEENLLEGGGSE